MKVTREKEWGAPRENAGWSDLGRGPEKASEVPFAGKAGGTRYFML